jgi:hypothetical protein
VSLTEFQRESKNAWLDTLQANSPFKDSDDKMQPQLSNSIKYEDRLDQVWINGNAVGQPACTRLEPLQLLTAYGIGNPVEDFLVQATDTKGRIHIGQWDKPNNLQRHYGVDNTANRQIFHVNPLAAFDFAVPSYSDDNWRASGIFERLGSGSMTAEGYRGAGAENPGFVIFEEAEPSAGWDAGYMIMAGCQLRENSTDYDRVIGKVALKNGPAPADGNLGRGIILPIPCFYSSSGTHPTAHTGPLAGVEVVFSAVQFAPDPDSTLAAPKGRLFFFNNQGDNSHRNPSGAAGAATVASKFVQVVEFNPTSKAPAVGEVNRVDNRVRLLSRCLLTENETIANGGIGLGVGGNFSALPEAAIYHPPSDTIIFYINTHVSGAGDGNSTIVRFSLAVAVAKVTTPTAQNVTETGKVVTFGSTVEGDLGERIGGHLVDWTLDRRSTEGELLVPVGGVGGTATVQNGPIDGQSDTDNSLTVFDDLVALTEAVDYTVDISTGIITGLGIHFDGSVYTCDYEHQGVADQPPHSILRSASSRSDTDGLAITRVEIPDDVTLEDTFDGLGSVDGDP